MLKRIFSAIHERFTRFDRSAGLALMRVCLGLNVLFFLYVQRLGQARFLWGSDGTIPWKQFSEYVVDRHSFSLYALTPDGRINSLIYIVGALVSLAFTLGIFTRFSSVLFYIFTWSLYERNPMLLTGGDNILYLVAFYLMFVDSGRVLSFDSLRGLRNWRSSPFLAVLHQFGWIAIAAQVCLLYLTSAFYKIQGYVWQDGTALYYILRTNEFALDSWTHYIYNNAEILTILTYGTMLFQMSFPFLVFHRWAKWPVLAIAVMFHSGIAFCMGLVSFSFAMLATELVFLSDSDYASAWNFVRGLGSWIVTRGSLAVAREDSASR